mmetsp:Transcript_57993/g.173074  ORF Transcript_57993/g.173074 Transcript_57993/m.173074 type:complete len:235 (+) Transcript_57993:1953-2657(+)
MEERRRPPLDGMPIPIPFGRGIAAQIATEEGRVRRRYGRTESVPRRLSGGRGYGERRVRRGSSSPLGHYQDVRRYGAGVQVGPVGGRRGGKIEGVSTLLLLLGGFFVGQGGRIFIGGRERRVVDQEDPRPDRRGRGSVGPSPRLGDRRGSGIAQGGGDEIGVGIEPPRRRRYWSVHGVVRTDGRQHPRAQQRGETYSNVRGGHGGDEEGVRRIGGGGRGDVRVGRAGVHEGTRR